MPACCVCRKGLAQSLGRYGRLRGSGLCIKKLAWWLSSLGIPPAMFFAVGSYRQQSSAVSQLPLCRRPIGSLSATSPTSDASPTHPRAPPQVWQGVGHKIACHMHVYLSLRQPPPHGLSHAHTTHNMICHHLVLPTQVMEALVKCREANPVNRFWGACNEVTYELSKCV